MNLQRSLDMDLSTFDSKGCWNPVTDRMQLCSDAARVCFLKAQAHSVQKRSLK